MPLEKYMETVKIRNPGMYWDITANIHFPPNFNSAKRYPAVISNHPIGSCKEQTSGNVYGAALAKAGFVVIVPDASFQGGSGGEPRRIIATSSTTRNPCPMSPPIGSASSESVVAAAIPLRRRLSTSASRRWLASPA
jgi:dienelactone hydrolase